MVLRQLVKHSCLTISDRPFNFSIPAPQRCQTHFQTPPSLRFLHRVLPKKQSPHGLRRLPRPSIWGFFETKPRAAPFPGARRGSRGPAPPPPPPPPRRGSKRRCRPAAGPRTPAAGLADTLCPPFTQALALRPSAPEGRPGSPPRSSPPPAGQCPHGLYLLLSFRHGAAGEPSCEGQEAWEGGGMLGNVVSERVCVWVGGCPPFFFFFLLLFCCCCCGWLFWGMGWLWV